MDYEGTPEARGEIVIHGLVKDFGDVRAASGLTLDIREGELLGLLGANGAGKTTTISILVGLLEPSAGSARIGGLDVTEDMAKIKERIGGCPQEAGAALKLNKGKVT